VKEEDVPSRTVSLSSVATGVTAVTRSNLVVNFPTQPFNASQIRRHFIAVPKQASYAGDNNTTGA
jgi:hypothetical protein